VTKQRFLLGLMFRFLLGALLMGGLGTTTVYAAGGQLTRERPGGGGLPPVDIQNVSRDAMEEGVFRVKFSPEAIRWMEEHNGDGSVNGFSGLFSLGPDGFLETGLAAFDSLSKAHSLVKAIPIMDMLYEASPVSHQWRDRHKEWGFHLWYEFKTTMKTDIVDVLHEYMRIPDILIAEPVYKIKSIGAVKKDTSYSLDSPWQISQSSWTPDDPDYASKQWHFNNTGQLIGSVEGLEGADISMPEAWGITKGNPAVIVAVIDGGVQSDHPDIAANMWPGIGYNFVDGDATITPDNHGTHVAGTIAAVSNNSTGVAGIAGGDGSAPGVQIMTCQIFKNSTSGGVAQAMIYAADNGAAISQNSWGYEDPETYSQLHLDAIDYFNANGGGGVMEGGISIFAAGNSNSQQAWYPAYYEGAFAVASTNNLDKRSGFSNYGEWIDLSAPGSLVYSTRISSSYGTMSGTSMACPHVSGVAALILSMAPGQFTAEEVESIIKNSADDHYVHNPDYIGLLGNGRLNAHAALVEAINLLGGVMDPYAFEATASGTSQIMLTWHKNEKSEPVMIAWSPDGVFGTPEIGTSYVAGQTIPGGGIVLYAGTNTIYSHTGRIPNTHYYYRAWSYNPDGEYSFGTNASARTDCLALTLPFTETFSGGQVPPECWSVLDNDGDGKNWFIGSEGYTPQTGSYAAVSESYLNEHGPLTPDNWLISPHFSSSTEYVKVTYWVKAQDQDWAEETYSVMVSTSGKQVLDFIELFSETLSDGEWHERVLHIPDMAGKLIYVAFRHYGSTDQYQILIDNIHIGESSPPLIYTITSTAGSGGSISPSGSVIVNEGDNQSFSISPDTGYLIADVIVDGSGIGPQTSYVFNNVQADHTIAAVFEPISYTISASASPGGSISPSGSVMVSYGQNQSFAINANPGYEIDDVIVNGESIGPQTSYTFSNVQSDHTIHVVFEPNMYSIYASAGFGGSITPSGSVMLAYGQDQTFTILPNNGFVIFGIFVDGISIDPVSSYSFSYVQSDHSIHASFAAKTYTIDSYAGVGGSITPSGSVSIDHGHTQVYEIIPDQNYQIIDVIVDGLSIGPQSSYRFANVTSDHQIEAFFAINTYTIIASAGVGGTISPTGELVVAHGDSQTYAVTADAGYHIADVVVDGVSQGAVDAWVFEGVSTNHQIEAFFAINTYTITATAGAGGTISPTGEQVVAHGDSQTYAITADAGYHIANVVVDGMSQGAVESWVFEGVSTNHQIDAFFAINTYTITATAGAGGTISPTGEQVVAHGDSHTYAITADTGYHIADVVVDGVSQGALNHGCSKVSARTTRSRRSLPSTTIRSQHRPEQAEQSVPWACWWWHMATARPMPSRQIQAITLPMWWWMGLARAQLMPGCSKVSARTTRSMRSLPSIPTRSQHLPEQAERLVPWVSWWWHMAAARPMPSRRMQAITLPM
jgi:subtilisin family serine protease